MTLAFLILGAEFEMVPSDYRPQKNDVIRQRLVHVEVPVSRGSSSMAWANSGEFVLHQSNTPGAHQLGKCADPSILVIMKGVNG